MRWKRPFWRGDLTLWGHIAAPERVWLPGGRLAPPDLRLGARAADSEGKGDPECSAKSRIELCVSTQASVSAGRSSHAAETRESSRK